VTTSSLVVSDVKSSDVFAFDQSLYVAATLYSSLHACVSIEQTTALASWHSFHSSRANDNCRGTEPPPFSSRIASARD